MTSRCLTAHATILGVLVMMQPRYMSGVLCWPEPASGVASEIVAALTDAGHLGEPA